jgi:putative toxin-antitoxin system antitoxin component (TIGR02293 family)
METQVVDLLGGVKVLGEYLQSNLDLVRATREGLPAEQSDVVVRTATVLARAIDVLGDKKKAVHWLTTSNRALGGEIPITLLDTSAGVHEIETLPGRIEYGVYS